MQVKIVDSRPWEDENGSSLGTIYTVYCEDENGSELVEVNVRGDEDSLGEQLGKAYNVDTSEDAPTFTEIDDDSVDRFKQRQATPPEAYAAFIRLYLEWMEMSEDEQVEYTRKNVKYAGYNHKRYANSGGLSFKKSGDEMYGEEFDGYVSEAWASFGERFTDVDAFAIYLEKNYEKHSSFPMSGDMLRRAAQNMMAKQRRQQINFSKNISTAHTEDDDNTPDMRINVEEVVTYDDFVKQIQEQIANPVRKQIFDALIKGYKKGEISDMLGISAPAVSRHVKKIGDLMKNIQII